MLDQAMQAVHEFNKKHNFPLNRPFECQDTSTTAFLLSTTKMLRVLSETAKTRAEFDLRARSMHLILQELSETLEGMARVNRVETIDGLCDTIYVLIGCALTFGFPLSEAFEEVQRSNMSKDNTSDYGVKPIDPLHPKGTNYFPPNIQKVLEDQSRNPDCSFKVEK